MNNKINEEKYYMFNNGRVFKYDMINQKFFLLDKDGNWIYYPSLMDIYYDAASDYFEVTIDDINQIINKRRTK